MKKFTLIPILVFFAFLVPFREVAFAEGGIAWPESAPICEAPETQWNMRMVPDGSGGAIIVWEDYRNGDANIYAQKINENGEPKWVPTDGVVVCDDAAHQAYPVIVGDGSGGAIIAWQDNRNGADNIYALRISSAGETHSAWTDNGVPLSTSPASQSYPDIVSDGNGGAVIVWQEEIGGSWSICAQSVASDESFPWGLVAQTVSQGAERREYPKLINSTTAYVIITWEDCRNTNYDIYAQRMKIIDGTATWTADGEPVSDETTSDQKGPEIVPDGLGGAIITWTDYRDGNGDIYAQRIDSDGSPATGWTTTNGVPVCTELGEQSNPVIIEDVEGPTDGAIIAWEDMRSGDVDIYAEKINRDDPPVSDGEDIFVVGGLGPQPSFRMVSDGQGGGIGICIENNRKIFAHRRDEYGQPVWSIYPGVLVCEGIGIIDSQIISDGSSGAIVAWVGKGVGGDDIFAQRVIDDSVTVSAPISGRVTRSDEEEPITGVEVKALKDDELVSSDITNTYGYYEIIGLAPGTTYEVQATWTVNGVVSSVSMEAFAPSYSFDFTLEIDYELGTIAGNVSGVEGKYVASLSCKESKRISGSGIQKILSPGNGIAFVELEQRDKVIVRVPVEMEGDYSIPNLLPGRFIARAYNGTIYSKPRTVNLQEGETLKLNFVFGIIPGETVFNYPNPAKKGSTTIRYYCGYSDPEAEIKIYNISGELVRGVGDSEIDKTRASENIYSFLWDCKNSSGKEVASGVYIYIVEVKDKNGNGSKKVVKRLAVIR